jgi:HEAT repeat protein
MEDQSSQSRAAAIEALAAYHEGLPRLIPELVKSAESAAPQTRADYLKLLSRIRRPSFASDAMPGLIGALDSRDGAIVAVAASNVLAFADPGPAPAMKSAVSAARGAVAPLIDALDRSNESKSKDAGAYDPVVAIAEALGRLAPETPSSERAIAALAKVLRLGETHRRVAAANALGRFHAGEALLKALTDSIGERDAKVRLAVLAAIHDVDFGAPFVVPKSLGEALEDNRADVRTAAASALWRAGLGVDPYVPALVRHAEHDADEGVRGMCSGTLQHLRPPQVTVAVLPALIPALRSPDGRLRIAACEILGEFGTGAAAIAPDLIRTMREPATNVPWGDPRKHAAQSLGRIAPRTTLAAEAIEALIEGLAANEIDLKIAALEALRPFGSAAAPAVPALLRLMDDAKSRKDDWVLVLTAETLALVGPRDVAAGAKSTLRDLAEHGNQNIRAVAANRLSELGKLD